MSWVEGKSIQRVELMEALLGGGKGASKVTDTQGEEGRM